MRSVEVSAQVQVRLTPRSGRNALTAYEAQVLHAAVTAAPAEGAANRALIALVSKSLDVPPSRVTLMSGHKSRDKRLRIEGITREALETLIESAIARQGR